MSQLDPNLKQGLTSQQVREALAKYGENALIKNKKINPIVAFFKQFIDPMIILLIIGATISLGLSIFEHVSGKKTGADLVISYVEPAIIMLVIILNSLLGAYQEVKSDRAVRALEKLNETYANVVRDGVVRKIKATELVPGDVIILAAGDTISADCKIIESSNLMVVEASLTGESLPVNKKANFNKPANAILAENTHLLYSSTYVTNGKAIALVIATGVDTEIGKINDLIQKQGKNITPLQYKLNKLGKWFGIGGIILLFISLIIQILLNNLTTGSWSNLDIYTHATVTAISLAVAAIPEGLLTFTTVILSVGIKNLAKEKALVKNLLAVETLGSASIICTDKTGTLTENKMKVVNAYNLVNDEELNTENTKKFEQIATYLTLCNDAFITFDEQNKKFNEVGDPTETGMLIWANEYKITKESLKNQYTIVHSIPFDSDRKMHSVLVKHNDQQFMITKGAPDIIIAKSNNINKDKIAEINEKWSSQSYRVIALARKKITASSIDFVDEDDFEFIGMIALMDPPRELVKESVLAAKKAGIKTVIITGDHITTAKAIALNLGIYEDGDMCVSGSELSSWDDVKLRENVSKISVYARVNPEDKLRIVKAWQSHEKVVSMTGDGVNDAPALKVADIGCSMGITGTDVSKQASDLILVDDNFNTIVSAIKNGRSTFDKIKTIIMNLLISSLAEIVVMLVGMVAFFFAYKGKYQEFYIFGASQLLWINLVSHGLPAIALGLVESEKDVMNRNPYNKKESIFSRGMGAYLIWQSTLLSLATLVSYVIGAEYAIANNLDLAKVASTCGFITLGLACGINTINFVSEKSIFMSSIKKYWLVWVAIIFSATTILLIALIPSLSHVFRMADITQHPKLIISSLSLGLCLTITHEIIKIVKQIINFKLSK
ncbi:cation-transporting P-type ATPase [Mycoplasmopsis californica HAZ160_1]|uniref:Cation-transporting P-type ATPase n=1 Tax=Mycoplasmopsis californica HAZ160_1 TaxID=1397850 RepID=A0AAT9F7I6_9BACT|nr:cation-translocating P-type ATPase [Mycoplasmopsis californica]BAP00870.1 cation-transporting P-type ATPase [Mycoplasmopsis californica HAZ160_1]BBG40727.1 cation-transporting P-type ATPase [Mycoplasmopsis californica]BBG41321.1 cation-transporting P-type ATPase [Mycoplasmopsis californica]BBG41914.1 cation-transporting P-type ATPase [Mycoplasmopsis californica]BBG42506.1 cation-transporting P-type ATPase [Mycoplasmopsis californica]